MRGTPYGPQDDLSGKRAQGAAPSLKVLIQTCGSFAFGRFRAIHDNTVLTGAKRFTPHATQDGQRCVRALRGQREMG